MTRTRKPRRLGVPIPTLREAGTLYFDADGDLSEASHGPLPIISFKDGHSKRYAQWIADKHWRSIHAFTDDTPWPPSHLHPVRGADAPWGDLSYNLPNSPALPHDPFDITALWESFLADHARDDSDLRSIRARLPA